MKMKKRLTALALAAVVGLGAVAPVGAAEASPIQPLTFPTYVNGAPVKINNAITYGGHTYVQLRELSGITNMGIEFVPQGSHSMEPGGGLPEGISIDQPTFVYVKDQVHNWNGNMGSEKYFKGVDITTLMHRYNANKGNLNYYFDLNGHFIANGKSIDIKILHSNGKDYMTVDDFREQIQPYLVDMCMQ